MSDTWVNCLMCGEVIEPDSDVEHECERPEHEPCERGTVGCSVHHEGNTPCETW